MLKKEAEYFGDIVILPFMDRYELVVLKTIAICEFGVQILYSDMDQYINSFSHCSYVTCLADYDGLFSGSECDSSIHNEV